MSTQTNTAVRNHTRSITRYVLCVNIKDKLRKHRDGYHINKDKDKDACQMDTYSSYDIYLGCDEVYTNHHEHCEREEEEDHEHVYTARYYLVIHRGDLKNNEVET